MILHLLLKLFRVSSHLLEERDGVDVSFGGVVA